MGTCRNNMRLHNYHLPYNLWHRSGDNLDWHRHPHHRLLTDQLFHQPQKGDQLDIPTNKCINEAGSKTFDPALFLQFVLQINSYLPLKILEINSHCCLQPIVVMFRPINIFAASPQIFYAGLNRWGYIVEQIGYKVFGSFIY